MHTLRQCHSWPPLRKPRYFYFNESIDQDPFAYFMSPAEDRDVFFNSHLAADINPKRKSRSLSPAHRSAFTILTAATAASSPTAKLRRWIEKMEIRCFHRSSAIPEGLLPPPDPVKAPEIMKTSSPPVRGRKDIRIGSRQRVGNNGRSKRRRPRVWKEPSEDIWPVSEEGEEEIGLGIMVEEKVSITE